MAECKDCGTKIGFMNTIDGKCVDCYYHPEDEEKIAVEAARVVEKTAINEQLLAQIEAILLTTETAPNLNITKRIDVISAQAAFEINNFKDMFVGFINPVKGRSNELEKQLDELRVRSTQSLKAKAHDIGANAIVAVDLDLSTVTIGGISMMMMMASGTAVVIEE